MTPQDLVERLEAAAGGSRELDWRIAELFAIPEPWREAVGVWPPFMPGSKYDKEVPAFTTSLDAALALAERVLPGWVTEISRDGEGRGWADVAPQWWWPSCDEDASDAGGQSISAATPALALCIATLKARTAAETGAVGTKAEGRSALKNPPGNTSDGAGR